jgi:hypothetical protein
MPKPPNPFIKVVQIPNPAAGAEFSIRAPGEGLWRIMSLAYTLTTDVNAANRAQSLVADDGTSVYFSTDSTVFHVASTARGYSAWEGAVGVTAISGDVILSFPTRGLVLPAGHTLRSLTTAIQVGDQYSGIAVQVEEFPNGPGVEWLPTVMRAEYTKDALNDRTGI